MRQFITCTLLASVFLLAACNNISSIQRNSPANAYKNNDPNKANQASVIGIGEPISVRQAAANATVALSGQYTLDDVMRRVAATYNLAVRWGSGVQQGKRADLVMKNLTFDEARNYIEDVYGIQIIKEGERRLLVLPSATAPRLTEFAPGNNVTLGQALRGLADQCNTNLMISENKDQLNSIRVSTRLRDMTCHEAFEALLTPHGLSVQDRGDYMTVGGLPQRQWTVNLFEPVRNEEVEVNYSSDFGAGGGEGEAGSGGSMTSGGSNQVSIKYERDLWKDLEGDLQALIDNSCPSRATEMVQPPAAVVSANPSTLLPPPSGSGANQADPSLMAQAAQPQPAAPAPPVTLNESEPKCGYVRINTAVGLVQMQASQATLESANEIITRTEAIANRRLILEARVLAVSRDNKFEQKGAIQTANSNLDANSFILNTPGSITSSLSSLLNGSVGGLAFGNNNLDAVVSLLERYSTTYQLMHPVMELMDRQRATLIDGTNEKYFVIRSTTTTGTASTTASDVEERTQFLGLQFSASAQVSDDPSEPHTISLQIPITSSDRTIPIPSNATGGVAGNAPIANTRLIDQKVRIRDGEIKAIGGLTTTVATDSESGMPVFRDIPLIGKLGNSQEVVYKQVEFVILLQVRRLN